MMESDRETLDILEHGRGAYRRRAWADAYASLSHADRMSPLGRDDLELLATAAYLTGRELDYRAILERVHHADVAANAPVRAARSAFWIGFSSMFSGDVALATGWLSRARRLLDSRECVEQGYLLLPEFERHLAEGNIEAAHRAASAAVEIGTRFFDADLIAAARHLQGRVLVLEREINAGLALLDEAMLAVIGGELSPIMTGLIYCSVIEVCQRVYAMSRAREWTSALSRWCEQQPELVAFTATCLVRRAEILRLQGEWPDAMMEVRRACERCEQVNRKPPAAALYQQGEIHRLRGEFEPAEEMYRAASSRGFEPQPGLAMMRLAQGRTDAAAAAIRRVLSGATETFQRTRLLPAYVEIMLAAGDIQEARSACRELEELASVIDTDAVRAMAAHGQGAVALAAGDAREAFASLRRAFELWDKVEAPHEAARARMLLGLAFTSLGDAEAGSLELAAARAVFEQLGAAPDLARLEAAEKRTPAKRHPELTPRELQVLRLIAAGKTNKAIARQLSVSERTVDRHVSNILTKLGVPSRAAATAYAYDHQLF